MTDLATHLLISNDLKTLLLFAIRDEVSKLTLSSTPLYVDDLVEESELVERQTDAPLGARSRLAARVAATPIALSPNGCKGKKSRIARRGKPRCGGWNMEEVKRFVGIDVAKVALDVFIGSAGGAFSVANDEVGIQELLRQMKPADFVIVEATGGLETPVAGALAAAGIPVAIVNPRQVRDFARATGKLAKTDRLDAEVLARFGE